MIQESNLQVTVLEQIFFCKKYGRVGEWMDGSKSSFMDEFQQSTNNIQFFAVILKVFLTGNLL